MALTQEDRMFLDRIVRYAREAMPDLDPQKTRGSVQLEKMMPVFEAIAAEESAAVEDVFIRYMDLASEAFAASEEKLRELLDE